MRPRRGSKQWLQAWCAFCEKEGNGDYDPAIYEMAFLQRVLKVLEIPDYGCGEELTASVAAVLEEQKRKWQLRRQQQQQ